MSIKLLTLVEDGLNFDSAFKGPYESIGNRYRGEAVCLNEDSIPGLSDLFHNDARTIASRRETDGWGTESLIECRIVGASE